MNQETQLPPLLDAAPKGAKPRCKRCGHRDYMHRNTTDNKPGHCIAIHQTASCWCPQYQESIP